jgi:hypothetical protein
MKKKKLKKNFSFGFLVFLFSILSKLFNFRSDFYKNKIIINIKYKKYRDLNKRKIIFFILFQKYVSFLNKIFSNSFYDYA